MGNISKAIEAVNKYCHEIECRYGEIMKYHTSIKIGGTVPAIYLPKNTDELLLLCEVLSYYETVPLIIGNGTNLLINDSKPLEMIVIKTTGINEVRLTGENEITAGAGISLSKLAMFACEHELSGLECAHGIPGSLGGAISMNAGAYGMEMKDVIHSTNCLNYKFINNGRDPGSSDTVPQCEPNNNINASMQLSQYTIVGEDHGFSYRHSRFSGSNDIILSSVIRLEKSDQSSIRGKMNELYTRRNESQPLDVPSAGSTFKRPKDGYAAEMIEKAGLKGYTIGGAQVSSKHSGFIVNNGGATYSDVMAVIEYVKEKVLQQFGVELEPEYEIITG